MIFLMDRCSFSVRSEWRHLEVPNLQPQSLQRPHRKIFFFSQPDTLSPRGAAQPQILAHWTRLRGEYTISPHQHRSANSKITTLIYNVMCAENAA